MKIYIRTDASVAIGSGHVMRCLTLAKALLVRSVEVSFVCRELNGNICDLIENQGFHVCRLPGTGEFDAMQDAELTSRALCGKPTWLIVDHYSINTEWEQHLRPFVEKIMTIDDMADRSHDCDMLLDQNMFYNMHQRYDGLTPPDCRLYLGPQYALLRDEFIAARRTLRPRDGIIRRLMVFFGGSDPTNETEKTLQALNKQIFRDIAIDAVVGTANPKREKIQYMCATMQNVSFHCQITNMAELMTNADLAIGAGGTATWERCFLGLPSLVIVVADNQAEPSQASHNAGLVRLIGKSAEVTEEVLSAAIRRALFQPDELKEMIDRCLLFMGQRNSAVHDEILACMCEVPDAS